MAKKVLLGLIVGVLGVMVAGTAIAQVTIDAATLNGTKVFMFKGSQYVVIDAEKQSQDSGYPKSISSDFPGMPFSSGVDAAVKVNDKMYFFKGGEYAVWDLEGAKMMQGFPKPLSDFAGLNFSKIDAAFADDKYFFFVSGDSYTIYSRDTETLGDGYPHKIADDFKGVDFDSIDAAYSTANFPINQKYLYMFSGPKYTIYELQNAQAKPGAPWTVDKQYVGVSF